jgi:endogenous inhibitor of DNA gyrase (YacG/DUF329 family)
VRPALLSFAARQAHNRPVKSEDRWIEHIECPVCGKTGEASFSGDDRLSEENKQVRSLSAGFTARIDGTHSRRITILCADCGEKVKKRAVRDDYAAKN